MCSWTFSPYVAEWWSCNVYERGNGIYDAGLLWNEKSASLPLISSHTELARDLVLQFNTIVHLAVVSYQVACFAFQFLKCIEFKQMKLDR